MKKPAGYEDYEAALDRAYRTPPDTACFIIENLARIYGKNVHEVMADFETRHGIKGPVHF